MAERSEPIDPTPGDEPAGLPEPGIRTSHQAELNAVRWLRTHGYPDAVPVQGGAETGVDIRGAYLVARVVFGTAAVTRGHIQAVVGARGRDDTHLVVLTSSRYELPAITYADSKGVMLLTYDDAGRIAAKNAVALAIVPPEERMASRSTPVSGPWVPILRHAPLGIAIYQLAFTATILISAARTGLAAPLGNVAFGLIVAVGLGALWFFVSRHLGRPKPSAAASPPTAGESSPDPD